jgi:hypothetical protein
VTLNIATPREVTWKYRKEEKGKVEPSLSPSLLSTGQIVQNLNFFINLMTQPLIKNNTQEYDNPISHLSLSY